MRVKTPTHLVLFLSQIVFEMLCGYTPFQGETDETSFSNICQAKLSFPEFVSEQAQDLIKQMLQV